ncbi:MAG TPA: hypothetical protein ENK57_09770 [Polyangiaceae bacterium]|nr:hypothetical protein [Polyangiaceae bacterium]
MILCSIAAMGCEGQIYIENGGGGGGGPPSAPRINYDAGVDPTDGGGVGVDAGMASPSCSLPAEGRCDGDTARWCAANGEQTQDCTASSQVCRIVGSMASCVDPDPPNPPTPPTSGCATAEELEVMNLASGERSTPLTCDPQMTIAARKHSQDMCDRGYFSHSSQDGRSPFDRMRAEGVTFGTAGENIAQGQRSAASVHSSWMGSSGHRANILNPSFNRIGVGLVECGGRFYWTQNFAD